MVTKNVLAIGIVEVVDMVVVGIVVVVVVVRAVLGQPCGLQLYNRRAPEEVVLHDGVIVVETHIRR